MWQGLWPAPRSPLLRLSCHCWPPILLRATPWVAGERKKKRRRKNRSRKMTFVGFCNFHCTRNWKFSNSCLHFSPLARHFCPSPSSSLFIRLKWNLCDDKGKYRLPSFPPSLLTTSPHGLFVYLILLTSFTEASGPPLLSLRFHYLSKLC